MISHDNLAEFSAVLWPALAGHLWQATIVAGLCLLVLPAFRGAGAKARQALWALAFARIAIPQALVFFVADFLGLRPGLNSGLGTRLQQVSDTVVQVTQPSMLADARPAAFGSATALHPDAYCILTIIWISGCALLMGRWWLRQYKFARSLRMAGHEPGVELMPTLESLKNRLGIRRPARLRIVWQGSEPGVYGVWHPVLVLPEEMPRQLSPAEAEAVLAHELVHVARWDNLWSNLQMLVCCIFWFYPIAWLLDRSLIAERERSCDERVIGALHNSRAYASGLIKIASIGLGLRVAGVSPMAGANLKRRIENMKNTNRKAGMSAMILLSSIAALTVLLYLAAGCKSATPSNLAIENPEESPLKIESAYVEDIALPPQGTKDVKPRLVNPKIVLKNNSARAIAVYELEFKKEGSDSVFLVNTEAGLAAKEAATIEANTIEKKTTSIFAGSPSAAKLAGNGGTWTVHVIVMRFNDGNVLTLHPMPILPPDGSKEIAPVTTSAIIGGNSGSVPGETTAPPPPRLVVRPVVPASPTNMKTMPKVVVVDPSQFIASTAVPGSVPPHTNNAPIVGRRKIVGGIPGGVNGGVRGGVVGGIPGGVSGGVPGGVVGGLLRPGAGPVAPPPPPRPVKPEPIP
jgi:beta-lactamase regulating signal transducer with metallopeptidase domain